MIPRHRMLVSILMISICFTSTCGCTWLPGQTKKTVPHEGQFGIYSLDIGTNNVALIYSTDQEIYTSALRLNGKGEELVFAQKTDGKDNENTEIYTIGTDGTGLRRLTNNHYWDLYPAWSANDTEIVFLSMRNKDLDIYKMESDGSNQSMLFDSGSHDADVDSVDGIVVFTSGSAIWKIQNDGTGLARITSPSNAGKWGKANLPVGDYDPRLSPSGTKVAFERLENVSSTHGSYNIYTINTDGSGETRLTETGYSQGLASWSHNEDRIVYVVAAIDEIGKYDAYMMNADGTDNRDITPSYFPPEFLVYSPVFSRDDSKIYFIGQWWEQGQ